jgi:cytochrome P450
LVPHEAIEDCTIDGYHVPRGTRLLVNVSKIHRDERVWSNPNEFDPERFLTTHRGFDVRGKNFEFFPFGSGRRMCPGVSFALHVMDLALATLLHGFDFATPSGEPVDMHESSGLTNLRATPLEVLLSPRLPSRLYGH